MSDVPDIYADDFIVSVTGADLAITLTRTEHSPGVDDPPKPVVGRIRLSHPVAAGLATVIQQAIAQKDAAEAQAKQAAEAESKVKH